MLRNLRTKEKLAFRRLKAERAKKIPKHRMRREIRELEPKYRRQHGAVDSDGRKPQILRGAQPAKKFCHLRQHWTGYRMPVRVAPGRVDLPLKLVVFFFLELFYVIFEAT